MGRSTRREERKATNERTYNTTLNHMRRGGGSGGRRSFGLVCGATRPKRAPASDSLSLVNEARTRGDRQERSIFTHTTKKGTGDEQRGAASEVGWGGEWRVEAASVEQGRVSRLDLSVM